MYVARKVTDLRFLEPKINGHFCELGLDMYGLGL